MTQGATKQRGHCAACNDDTVHLKRDSVWECMACGSWTTAATFEEGR